MFFIIFQLVALRAEKAPHLLPPLKDEYSPDLDPNNLNPEVLINQVSYFNFYPMFVSHKS
jgi:hypothetical protein